MGKKKAKKKTQSMPDKHVLYEASVQDVDVDYTFFQNSFKKYRGRRARTLREDFCGTALLACEWVRRNKENRAWGVDLDKETLDYARQKRVARLGDKAERLTLIHGNACEIRKPGVDIQCAMNFSYSIWKKRSQLLEYFRAVHASLNDDGLFILDSWGGPGAIDTSKEPREVEACRDWNGEKVPAFNYTWDQAYFNYIDNHIVCHIHFKVPGFPKMKKAFTYDWRQWSTPELCDLLREAGFADVGIYLEGWDDETDDTDGEFLRREEYTDMASWVAYLVAVK